MKLELGRVTSVYYESGVPVCDVQLTSRVNTNDESVPVARQHHSMFMVPRENHKVQMLKMGEQRFIVGILDKGQEYEDPELEEGEAAFQFDDETKLSFTENDDGNFDIHVEASGKIYIDGIPFSEHEHEYEDATVNDTGDGSGSESSATKTTGAPQ